MTPSQRLPYSAIVDRAPLKLPHGVRLVVWPIVNVEVWDIGRAMPRQVLPPPTGVTRLPDLPHWAWHEYGMRVGFWRLKAALDRLKITPTLSVNARVCLDYPRVAQAARDAGWEFMGHSYDQRPIHFEPNQRAMIRRAVKVIKAYTGKQPVGWLGPGFTERSIRPICSRGRHQIRGRLAVDDGHVNSRPNTARCFAALQHRAQRHRDDDGAAPPQLIRDALHGLLDRVCRNRSRAQRSCRLQCIRTFRHAVSHQYFEQVLAALRKKPGVVFWTGEQIMNGMRRKPRQARQGLIFVKGAPDACVRLNRLWRGRGMAAGRFLEGRWQGFQSTVVG